MSNEPELTVVGNLTNDPELRFTPSGAAVTNFTVASTPRSFNKQTNEWVDGETLFMRCSIWRDAAENVAESLAKGTRVVVRGRLKQRSYEKDGETKTVVEMEADEVGPSLRYATAKVTKTQRTQGQQGGQPQQDQWTAGPGQATGPAQQGQQGGWQGQPNPNQGGGWNANPNQGDFDKPPF